MIIGGQTYDNKALSSVYLLDTQDIDGGLIQSGASWKQKYYMCAVQAGKSSPRIHTPSSLPALPSWTIVWWSSVATISSSVRLGKHLHWLHLSDYVGETEMLASHYQME